jgi:PEP-CTERM motif
MRCFTIGICVLAGLWQTSTANAMFDFMTDSTATMTLDSPLLGAPFSITSTGTQDFSINTSTGVASVTSLFQGSDFPNPFGSGTLTYNLYNTTTGGTVTTTSPGVFTIKFSLLFELDITGTSPLAGLQLVTQQNAIFQASNITNIPFPSGTVFADPASPNDVVGVFIQQDPTGTFNPGDQAGTSFDRSVIINSVIPEPSSLALFAIGAGTATFFARARGRRRSAEVIQE